VIVQDITHEPYDRYMKEKVLDPLGMLESFYTQPAYEGKSAKLLNQQYTRLRVTPYPESDSSFFGMDWGFRIRFAKAADGSVASVMAFDRDYFEKVKP
jgi:CubicO group peptidase (beta-lactamase class C family)